MKTVHSIKAFFRWAGVIVGAIVLATGNQSVTAQSIGCNFVNSSAGGIDNAKAGSLLPTDMAGVPAYAQAHWNNLSQSGSGVTLTNSAGAAAALTIQWNAPHIASSGTFTNLGTPDGKLMDGFLQTGWPNTTVLNVNGYTNVLSIPQSAGCPIVYVGGLQSWYQSQGVESYTVVIYQTAATSWDTAQMWVESVAGSPFNGTMVAGPDLTPHLFNVLNTIFSGTYLQIPGSATSEGNKVYGANFGVFAGLTNDAVLIRAGDTDEQWGNGAMNGFQIVPDLPVAVSVNTAKKMATMPPQGLGVNIGVYDSTLINSRVAPMLKAAGITGVRMPGGSMSDQYNWQNNTGIGGQYVNSNDTFDNVMNTDVIPAGAQALVTVNYGSNPANNGGGDTNLAAAWVTYANVTKNYGIKYWEIGNEEYGNGYFSGWDWEYDLHFLDQTATNRVGQSALSPSAYGTNALQFISAMKAKDPSIKCGIHILTDAGKLTTWNQPLFQACGSQADFVIIHWYPSEPTTTILSASTTIVPTIQALKSQLTNIVGATKASQMQIAITETGADTSTGPAVSLFTADNYLTWLENGAITVDYWYFGDLLLANQTPGHAYYGAMMAHLLANVGDTFLTATTTALSGLRVHAAQRQDGKTGIMLVNMDPVHSIPATVNISGPALASSGTWYQFGLTNFIGTNDYPSYPVSTNTVSGLGNSFTVSVPPYTIIDLLIPPASNTPPVLAVISNQTVNAGQTVAFTAIATDTNQPQPTLTFNLLTAPTNAALAQLNNTNATFGWRPLVTQAGTTNSISLTVTDNSTPPLSATQSFTVIVNPLTPPALSALTLSNGQLAFEVSGQSGPDYAVETSTNLSAWNTLFITNFPAMPFIWRNTNAAAMPIQFFRVKIGPPLP
jgi:hypothetical protein